MPLIPSFLSMLGGDDVGGGGPPGGWGFQPEELPLMTLGLQSASASIDLQDGISSRQYTRSFLIYSDIANDEQYVLANCGVLVNEPHPTAPRAYVKSIAVSDPVKTSAADGTPCLQWKVVVTYASLAGNAIIGGPLSQPPRVSLSPYLVEVPAVRDYQGKPILNTAGDPYDPPLLIPTTRYKLRVQVNMLDPDFDAYLGMIGKVNADIWQVSDGRKTFTFAAKTAKVEPIEVPEPAVVEDTNQYYYPMAFGFDINPDTWVERVPSMGFRERDAAGKLARIFDDAGQELTNPAFLDEDGKKLPYPVDEDSIVIDEFETHEPVDFGVFNFGPIPA